jgi:hypothetical protein
VLFRVSPSPLSPAYGPDLVSAGGASGEEGFTDAGIRLDVTEGRMYLLVCTGSAHAEFANAVLKVTWLDGRGARIRQDEASGVFLAKATVIRLIATSPAHTSAASVALEPLGGRMPAITHLSAREIRFISPEPSGIEQ